MQRHSNTQKYATMQEDMPRNEFLSIHNRLLLEECILLRKLMIRLIEENLNLKNKLSENLRLGFPSSHLDKFEYIQNRLLENDTLLNTLTKDGHDLQVLLENNLSEDQFVHKVLKDKVFGLKSKIGQGEIYLNDLKHDLEAFFNLGN